MAVNKYGKLRYYDSIQYILVITFIDVIDETVQCVSLRWSTSDMLAYGLGKGSTTFEIENL